MLKVKDLLQVLEVLLVILVDLVVELGTLLLVGIAVHWKIKIKDR